MKKVLHVLTQGADELPRAIMAADQKAGVLVAVVELGGGAEQADYQALLEAIFQADSVQCW